MIQQTKTHFQEKPKRIKWGLLGVATMLSTLEYIPIWKDSADQARNVLYAKFIYLENTFLQWYCLINI